jgi:NIMA (never in mitosis gene a)-related kinase
MAKKYTVNCDVWSLGCVLYELCCLRPPFTAKDFPGLMKRVISGYYDPIPSRYSRKLATLIRRCLTVDHQRRPSAAELLQTDVFLMMESTEEGAIELLDTIRCPRVLKLLNNRLPESQYTEKKPKTLKLITDQNGSLVKSTENHLNVIGGSLKHIASEKILNIRAPSVERVRQYYRYPPVDPPPLPPPSPPAPIIINGNNYQPMHNVLFGPMKVPMNAPNGYVRLPKIASYKVIQ